MIVHGDFRVHVASHERLRFVANGAIAERGALGATSYDADVFGHYALPDQSKNNLTTDFHG